jgi:hypothetical protein
MGRESGKPAKTTTSRETKAQLPPKRPEGRSDHTDAWDDDELGKEWIGNRACYEEAPKADEDESR